jgi:uncharacterized protein YndB with AHSA1/START domain
MDRFDFLLPALPDRVWQALTDPVKLASWFMDNDLAADAGPGHRFILRPRGLAGLNGPLTAELLVVAPVRHIVMLWRYADTRNGPTDGLTVTWLVEPARGGSRLTVSHDSQATGRPIGTPETWRRLYGQRLRDLLSVGRLGSVTPVNRPDAEDPTQPVSRTDRRSPAAPESGPADPTDPAGLISLSGAKPDKARVRQAAGRRPGLRRQYAVVLAGCAALLIGLGAATWRLVPARDQPPDESADPANSAGTAMLGTAGASSGGRPTSPNRATASASAAATPSGLPSSSTDPGAGAPDDRPTTAATGGPGAGGPVTVSYHMVVQGLTQEFQVSVSNPGAGPATWRNVTIRLSGVNLTVTTPDQTVVHTAKAPLDCFVPTAAAATLAARATLTFTVKVAASVLGGVQSVQLDQAACDL